MSDNEFIARPFISHDGRDKAGVRAEVKVIIGHALVAEHRKPKNRNSTLNQFVFDAPVNKHPAAAWIDKNRDSEIFEILKDACDNEKSVSFRIEIQRKRNADRSIPMEELSPKGDAQAAFDNTFRHIVAVRVDEDSDWVVGSNMITSFKEDSSTVDNPHGQFKADDDDIFDDENDGTPTKKPVVSVNGGGSKSYNVRDREGKVNTESFAVMAPTTMIFFVKNYVNENIGPEAFSADEERNIAKSLIGAASTIQSYISGDDFDKADIGAYSHRFAEEVVRGVVKNYMPLRAFEEDFDNELANYIKKVTLVSKKIARWAVETVDELHGQDV